MKFSNQVRRKFLSSENIICVLQLFLRIVFFIIKVSNKVGPKLVIDTSHSYVAYQIEELNERNVTP